MLVSENPSSPEPHLLCCCGLGWGASGTWRNKRGRLALDKHKLLLCFGKGAGGERVKSGLFGKTKRNRHGNEKKTNIEGSTDPNPRIRYPIWKSAG